LAIALALTLARALALALERAFGLATGRRLGVVVLADEWLARRVIVEIAKSQCG
jgi:hypothetical protein